MTRLSFCTEKPVFSGGQQDADPSAGVEHESLSPDPAQTGFSEKYQPSASRTNVTGSITGRQDSKLAATTPPESPNASRSSGNQQQADDTMATSNALTVANVPLRVVDIRLLMLVILFFGCTTVLAAHDGKWIGCRWCWLHLLSGGLDHSIHIAQTA